MVTHAAAQSKSSTAPGFISDRGLLLQRKCACGSPASSLTGECAECKSTMRLQAKLAIGASKDPLEQEADRVAEQVLAKPAHSDVSSAPPHIQRFAEQGNTSSGTAPASVDRVLARSGKPLDTRLRHDMEQRFGHDFSRVRVHSGVAAEQSARDVNAHAYTVGHNIVFGAGRFAPGTHQGRRLIAHELTHVVQQARAERNVAGVNRSGSAASSGRPQLFRKAGDEAHYPTEDEQREIEKLLSRQYKTTKVVTSATGEPVIQKGRTLTVPQIRELAARLEGPFSATLDSLDSGGSNTDDALDATSALKVVEEARQAILDRFGKYSTRRAILTLDTKTTEEARKKAGQVLIILGDPDAANALARTIVETHCEKCASELDDLDDDSKSAVTGAVIAAALQQHGDQLRRVAKKRVPGKHSEEAKITLRLTERTEFYANAVHELIHEFAHPAFHAAFLKSNRNIVEGFTEYFTREIVSSSGSYEAMYKKVAEVPAAMNGPFISSATGGSAEESMRQAYFGGRLDLIGWKPTGPKEQEAVEKAGGSAPWDPSVARTHAAAYQAQAQAQQGASRNVLQVGLFFTQKSSDTIAVRYARVIARTEPYAKGQLFLEGQVLGSPSLNPDVLGASLGIGAEYQEPYFYAGGGVRFVGTTLPGTGTNRLDVSPFVGIGVRPWQTIRVGAEGFLLVPLPGQDKALGKALGAGITLGVEL